MSSPRTGKRRVLLVAGGIVAAAFLSIGLNTFWAFTSPERTAWAEAAAHVRAGLQDGDAIGIVPHWAAEARLALGNGPLLPVVDLAQEDLWRYRRLWVVAVPSLGGGAGRIAVRLANRYLELANAEFGGVEVRLYELPVRSARFDFVESLPSAEVRIERWVAGKPEPYVDCDQPLPRGGGWNCPAPPGGKRRHWMKVSRSIREMDDNPRECITAHPWSRSSVVITYPAVPMGGTLALEVGHTLNSVRNIRDEMPTLLRVLIDGKELRLLEIGSDSSWERWRFDTTAFATPGSSAQVVFRIAAKRIEWRFPCFAARILDEMAESRSPPGTGAGPL